MSNFSSLKAAIQQYIKTNGNEEITGAVLQDILLSMVSVLGDTAINDLETALQTETTNRTNADGTLQQNINNEATARGNADTALGNRLTAVEGSITTINTMLGEGYLYAGLATTSTDPGTPTGKVFYIATVAGTYTNFSGIELTQGINILKYNGSAWSSEQVLAIDAVPTAGSNNLVKSGGVFNVQAKNISINSLMSDKYVLDSAIENYLLYQTSYTYNVNTIFGNQTKVSNIIDGVYVKHINTGDINVFKVDFSTKTYSLIKTFSGYPSGWVRLDFDSEIELNENEFIGVDNNFGYVSSSDSIINNPGQFALIKSSNSLTFSDNLEIGIVTFRKNNEEIQKKSIMTLESDRLKSIIGDVVLTQNKNYIDSWTIRFENTAVFFGDMSYIREVTGCFVKVNKILFSSILLYKANISTGAVELLKSVLITDNFKDGQMIDIKFDDVVILSNNERIAIGGAFWYANHCGSLNGFSITLNGEVSDFVTITYGFLPYFNKKDVRVSDYNDTKNFISSISEDIETDNAINGLPRCKYGYYQQNQLWGNKYQTQSCCVDGIFWKVHYDDNYTDEKISIYKVNLNSNAKTLIKEVPFDENWGEGEIVQIPLDKREVLWKDWEYIMILAPIYYKDWLSDGNSITCSLTGDVSANTGVDIGFFTYCNKSSAACSVINGLQQSNRFRNKKVAWYGTSIPAGEPHTGQRDVYSYANIAVHRLGGAILNYCVSGSCLISKENTESTTYDNIRFSDTTAPVNYQNSMIDLIGTLNEPDWFVFDFGANDAAFYKSQFDALDFDNLDFTSTDKRTFLGAYNLVIKSLLEAKPKAKIIIVTHFSDDSVNGTHEDYYLNLNKLIRRIGEYWQIPVFDVAHRYGLMYRNGINTLNAYMPIDGLHPGNNLEVVHMFADVFYKLMLNL